MNNEIIVNKDNFILISKTKNNINIVSTFKKQKNHITSNIILNKNQIHRINELNNIILNISIINEYDNFIYYDCLNKISQYLFKDNSNLMGIIHFQISNQNITKNTLYNIFPKVLIQYKEPDKYIISDTNIKFNITKPKYFSIILNKGFIFVKAEKDKTTLLFTTNQYGYVGKCNSFNNNYILNCIKKLWNVFKYCNNKNEIIIYTNPNLLKLNSNLNLYKLTKYYNSEVVEIEHIGSSIYV